MYDVLHDNVYRKSWDPAMLESFEIARLSPNADVGYYSCESYNIFQLWDSSGPYGEFITLIIIHVLLSINKF